MRQRAKVLGILIDNKGKTIGARLQYEGISKFYDVYTSHLIKHKNDIELENAIIDSNGFVKSKKGYPDLIKIPQYKENKSSSLYNTTLTLCHGSKDILKRPYFGGGEDTNDYGSGFYTVLSKNIELAKEWACSRYNKTGKGYVNTYEFDTRGMKILYLDKLELIYWVTLTATKRNIISNEGMLEKLQSRYSLDLTGYDCIYGWRCDDTFSKIVINFLNENYTVEAVQEAIKLGHLQSQFVLISEKAFNNLSFISCNKVNDFSKYRDRFIKRTNEADSGVKECMRRHRNGRYITDFL